MDKYVKARNKINRYVYSNFLKKMLFKFEPEKVHNKFVKVGKVLGSNYGGRKITSVVFDYENKALEQTIKGIKFRNPVGLAGGFDKNAELTGIMKNVGFGFMEVGSITAKASGGNEGTRLKRLPEKKSLWVYMGLNNHGADFIHNKLKSKKFEIPVGINVAKTNCIETTDPEIGLKDYMYSIKKFMDIGDYFVLNISCPNAYGGIDFSNPKLYENLLKEVSKLKLKKLVFTKLSPDLSKSNVDKIIKISLKYKITGFICSNLTKKHDIGSGGLSGKYVQEKSDKLLSYVYRKTKGKFILIGTGGVFSAEDAYKKIKLGANLVQLITGMIYEGPSLISDINHGLVQLLKKDGYKNIGEAVGSYYK